MIVLLDSNSFSNFFVIFKLHTSQTTCIVCFHPDALNNISNLIWGDKGNPPPNPKLVHLLVPRTGTFQRALNCFQVSRAVAVQPRVTPETFSHTRKEGARYC